MDNNKTILILGICVLVLVSGSLYFLHPRLQGDGVSYIEAINFLKNNTLSNNLIYNRIITTFAGLWVIILGGKIFGNELGVWFAMNAIFYAGSAFIFYKILNLIFESKKTAFLGTLFLIGNYAMLRFGLNFLMDIGGWLFYIFSIYFLLKYAKFNQRGDLLFASASVGVGGLFKEYAFLPIIPIAIFLIYENRNSFLGIIKKAALPAILAVTPILCVYVYAYFKLNYTYLDWLDANQKTYVYPSRIIEYIKSLGSLLNILGLLFIGGLIVLFKKWKFLETRIKLFLLSIFASILPIFFWPAITQRILFIAVPFVILISGFFINRYKNYWPIFGLLSTVYILTSFFMDSYLLPNINLPI